MAAVNKLLDIASLGKNNLSAELVRDYQFLKSKASDCLKCGSCEERRPFSVQMMDKMDQTAALFER